MRALLELRERLKAFYGRYTSVLSIILKFALALGTYLFINMEIGYSSVFTSIFAVLIMALLSSILPVRAIPLFSAALITIQAFALGYDAGAIAFMVLLLLLILFLRFVPEDSLILIFLPVALYCGAPEVVPVCFGLKKKPLTVLSVGSGVVVYYLLDMLHRAPDILKAYGASDYAKRLQALAGGVFGNSEMVLNLLTLAGVLILVCAIRKLSFNGSWLAAVIIGSLFYPVLILLGDMALGTSHSLIVLAAGAGVSAAAALILMFFIFNVDYRKSEYLQFEDDGYYYYVKAIPKISVRKDDRKRKQAESPEQDELPPMVEKSPVNQTDLEKKLEDSLNHLS